MAPGSCCHCWHGAVNGSSVVFALGERATGSGHGSVVSRDAVMRHGELVSSVRLAATSVTPIRYHGPPAATERRRKEPSSCSKAEPSVRTKPGRVRPVYHYKRPNAKA